MIRLECIASTRHWCAIVLGLVSLGCQQSSPTKVSQSDARPAAEQSFDEISQIVKNALETGAGGMQGGFVSEKANARSHFSVHNTVSSKVIPPADPGETYRATITVTSRTDYSLRRIPESEKKGDEKEKSKHGGQDSGVNPLDDSRGTGSTANGVEVLDDSLITSPTKPTRPLPGQPEDSVARRADEEVRNYDLAYENNRWVLKTDLDLKTELSVKNAFDYALKLQP
jgi:hypothetical protein